MTGSNSKLAIAALLIALPSAAHAQDQTGPLASSASAEIADVRAELARVAIATAALTARLEALERAQGGPAAGMTALAGPAPVVRSDLAQGPAATALASNALADVSGRVAPAGTIDRALTGRDGFGAELSASADATTVAIKLSRTDSTADAVNGVNTTWTFAASAPLTSGERFSDIGTLDGLSNGARLRVQYSQFVRPFSDAILQPGYQPLIDRVRDACLQRLGTAASAAVDCNPPAPSSQWVRENAPALEAEFLSLFRRRPDGTIDWSARAYGLEGSIGYKQFKHLLAGPSREDTSDRTPWSARGFYSWLPDVRHNALTAALEYQRSYRDASTQALCPVSVTAAEGVCAVGPLGEPKRTEKLLWSLEYRQQFRFDETALIPSAGVSAMLTYDSENETFGVDLPIYLVSDPKKGLIGGVRLGYRDEDDEFIAGVFVGTAFSLR